MKHRLYDPRTMSRRDALGTLGALGVVSLLGARAVPSARAATRGACSLTPELTIGPYFVDENLNRSDVRGDSTSPFITEAVPLHLAIDATSLLTAGCAPIAGVQIDIWHCHAGGLYSDEAQNGTTGETWLRGYQVTDANGRATFTTIYPGWYRGRTVHIHVMARYYDSAGNATYAFTTQLFFDDATSDVVLAEYPYNTRGDRDTRNSNDGIYDASMLLALEDGGDGSFAAAVMLGLELEGAALPDAIYASGFDTA